MVPACFRTINIKAIKKAKLETFLGMHIHIVVKIKISKFVYEYLNLHLYLRKSNFSTTKNYISKAFKTLLKDL